MDSIETIRTDSDEQGSESRRDRRGWKLAGAAAAATVTGLAVATTAATPVLGLVSANHNETVLD